MMVGGDSGRGTGVVITVGMPYFPEKPHSWWV